MRGETILIIDDEKLIRWSLQKEFTRAGCTVLEADSCRQALELLATSEPDAVLLDQRLPDGTGIDVLQEMKKMPAMPPVIMLTAVDKSDIAVQAMKLGAFDYVTKPVNFEELKLVVEKALESTQLKRQVAHFLKSQEQTYGFCGMVGSSAPMKKVFDMISRIAQSSGTTVLITGESGTGKELAAKAIHFLGARREKPLMTVNCSALTETLIESELFGHEKGAFTDARVLKKGIFEIASGGTVFLDEIGDISPKLQVKLLRVLEQKTFQRVGGTADISVDVRIVAATNQNLEERVHAGSFRSDLFYRLNVARIHLPLLKERGEDIVMLADYFVNEFNAKFHKHYKGLTEETQDLFRNYPWPGNVREMRNVLERSILLGDNEWLAARDIEFSRIQGQQQGQMENPFGIGTQGPSLYELEKKALVEALEKSSYNQSQAARLLKISRDTLRYRMKKYSIPPR